MFSQAIFRPHIIQFSIFKSLYFDNFSIIFRDVFRSVGIAISISMQFLSSLPLIVMLGLLDLISLSVWTGTSQRMLHVSLSFPVTVSGVSSYHLPATLMLYCFLYCFMCYLTC